MRATRFSPAQIWTIAQVGFGSAVFVRPENSNIVLPVYVSEADIQTILVELTHILAPRPMLHELIVSTINALQGKLDRVEIYGTRAGSYLCRIVVVQNGKEIKIEARPADILCLSAHTNCPVHIDDELLAHNGVPAESVCLSSDGGKGSVEQGSVKSLLERDLQEAVEKEDYENAALIRDQINALAHPRSEEAPRS